VTYQINWEVQAIDLTAGFLRDDADGVGRYRVFYQIDDDAHVIQIDHVGRI
jgi:hypothetical protein